MLEMLFSEQNVQEAMVHVLSRRNVRDHMGLLLADLPNYWQINRDLIYEVVQKECYLAMDVKQYSIAKKSGEPRYIADITHVDMLLHRMLYQVLSPLLLAELSPSCFAYVPNRSVPDAMKRIIEWVEQGRLWCARLDINDFFDSIPLHHLCALLSDKIGNNAVFHLVEALLHARIVSDDGNISVPTKGILQGSPLSPLLSNFYLAEFDRRWGDCAYLRYADDIMFFDEDKNAAVQKYETAERILHEEYALELATEKCMVSEAIGQIYLGYSLRKYYGRLRAEPIAKPREIINETWQTSQLTPKDRSLFITQSGEVSRRDFSIAFAAEDTNYIMPPEGLDTIHLMEKTRLSSSFMEYANQKHIRICFYDRYGRFVGDFLPQSTTRMPHVIVEQIKLFSAPSSCLQFAIPLLVATFHNMIYLIRHYRKKDARLKEEIDGIKRYQENLRTAQDIPSLMLIEARARQLYYRALSLILMDTGFSFHERTRRPPRDPANALMSFGNTILYQRIATEIHKAGMDIRFSFLHASQTGRDSLNLDIAEVFKPLLVDRAVLSLAKRRELSPSDHFTEEENGGVYLNKSGKQIFLKELQDRLFTCITVNGKRRTWMSVVRDDVYNLRAALVDGKEYEPYHHR